MQEQGLLVRFLIIKFRNFQRKLSIKDNLLFKLFVRKLRIELLDKHIVCFLKGWVKGMCARLNIYCALRFILLAVVARVELKRGLWENMQYV